MAISYIAEKIHDLKQNVTFTSFSLVGHCILLPMHLGAQERNISITLAGQCLCYKRIPKLEKIIIQRKR